ncbi:MAG TPA: hypothetical protein VMJ34_11550 [Bryobacteraceae bacterium]|nr:hypothetical protein [Bryobacteraceae bacterium]
MLIEKYGEQTPVSANGSRRHTDAEQSAIREQMQRMLSHSLFRNSKRYPPLFRFVVEAALQENAGPLKERQLGIQVFGREPDYDTNLDPIVRYTAGEIRKRIAQYYHLPEHQDELRIELLSGSYVPEFHFPVAPSVPAVDTPGPAVPSVRRFPTLKTGIAVLAVTVVAGVFALRPWQSRSALDRFWSPVFTSNDSVSICLAPPVLVSSFTTPGGATADSTDASARRVGVVGYGDAITLARLTGMLQARGHAYRFSDQRYLDLADMKQGPVVLIGGFNNAWTVRLTSHLRFTLALDAAGVTQWIQDNQNPGRRAWAVHWTEAYPLRGEDYAVVSRFFDPNTGHLVVAIAGITGIGTLAAGEFVTDNRLMDDLSARAPSGWERRNFQVVLSTKVIQGSDAVPRIVATHFW